MHQIIKELFARIICKGVQPVFRTTAPFLTTMRNVISKERAVSTGRVWYHKIYRFTPQICSSRGI